MQLGISTSCFYPLSTEDAVQWLCTHGAENIEIFFNAMGETELSEVTAMKQLLDEHHARAVSIHPFTSQMEPMLFFSEYNRRFEEGLELYSRFFQAAAVLEAKVLVFHGDRLGSSLPEEESFSRFAVLAELGQSFGVTLTQENIIRSRSRDPGYLLRMKNALGDRAAFTLDIKQARRAGFAAEDYLIPLGSAVKHIHLSDADESADCLPVGAGTEDMQGLFCRLKAQGFDGGAVLELYRQNYGQYEELIASLRHTRYLAAQAGYTGVVPPVSGI